MLVTLQGTGSAEPNKYRGSSAILIRMASGASVLLDAGEGAAGALVRRFGLQGARQAVASLAVRIPCVLYPVPAENLSSTRLKTCPLPSEKPLAYRHGRL